MVDLIDLLNRPGTVVAVVGATDDPRKFGNRIYLDLRGKGIEVRAVNPGRDTVAGDPCWPSLSALPEPPTIVDVVVPPARTMAVLDECERLGLKAVWIQPGAADGAVRSRLAEGGFDALVDECVMVEARHRTRE